MNKVYGFEVRREGLERDGLVRGLELISVILPCR